MPKQETSNTNTNATAMNDLATKVRIEQAEQQYRLANFFTPYSFDPEQVDFDRMGQLIEKYGNDLSKKVFFAASPSLQEKVDYAVNEIVQRQGALEALIAAGAEVSVTDEQLYQHAQDRVINNSRYMSQARMASVK